MMLSRLRVGGYRSLRDVEWHPGALNVLIGPNAGGKSNVLQTLELIHRCAAGGVNGFVKHHGGLSALRWDGTPGAVEFCIDTADRPSTGSFAAGGPTGPFSSSNAFSYTLSLIAPQRDAVAVAEEVLWHSGAESEPVCIRRSGLSAAMLQQDGDVLSYDMPEDQIGESALARTPGPGTAHLTRAFASFLRGWAIYAAVDFPPDCQARRPPLASYETQVDSEGGNTAAVLHTLYSEHRAFRDLLDDAMRTAFGDEFEELVFRPVAAQRVELCLRWRSLDALRPAADLSDGTLRFLFLVAVLANPESPALVAIDEPDAGLHPSMLPIVAELAQEATRRSQVVFTTHSPELLDAFGPNPPTTTVAELTEGRTVLSTLEPDRLARWVSEYRLGRMFSTGELEALV
ncbi:MAG: AAA family ATPase [Armatimonadia bacterium]|nr:AAA family ATPase [Armatimonadia bacterium]